MPKSKARPHWGLTAALCAISVGLIACQGGDNGANKASTTTTAHAGSAAMAGLTAAVPGAGALGVDLRFGLSEAPTAVTPFHVTLVVSSNAIQPPMWVHVRGDDGLTVQEPADRRVERIDAGAASTLDLTLTAATPGMHLVTVDAVLDLATAAPARSFQFPVLVN